MTQEKPLSEKKLKGNLEILGRDIKGFNLIIYTQRDVRDAVLRLNKWIRNSNGLDDKTRGITLMKIYEIFGRELCE